LAQYLFIKPALIFQQPMPMIEFKANVGFSDAAILSGRGLTLRKLKLSKVLLAPCDRGCQAQFARQLNRSLRHE